MLWNPKWDSPKSKHVINPISTRVGQSQQVSLCHCHKNLISFSVLLTHKPLNVFLHSSVYLYTSTAILSFYPLIFLCHSVSPSFTHALCLHRCSSTLFIFSVNPYMQSFLFSFSLSIQSLCLICFLVYQFISHLILSP